MTDDLMALSCREFMAKLSSKAAVPGGGGAAALGGALGVGLANMVGSLTVGKPKYAQFEGEVQSLLEEGLSLQHELLDLVNADAEAFAPLAEAYAFKADDEAAKARKATMLSEASIIATKVPLAIAEKTYRAMQLTREIGDIGSKLAVSDAACAILFLRAALGSAGFNVMINLPYIKDDDFVKETNQRLKELLTAGETVFSETMMIVETRMQEE